jgi:hypothetical protein
VPHRAGVGLKRQFDPEQKKLIGNAAADELLTRSLRKPFVGP